MQLKAIAGEKAIEDAENQHQNRGLGKEGSNTMRGDPDQLLEELSAIPGGWAIRKGGRVGLKRSGTGGRQKHQPRGGRG